MDAKERDELLASFEKGRFRKELPALSEALIQGKLDVAEALVEMGANVNEYAKRPAAERGMAPIHFAESPEAVRLLAKAQADVNAPYKQIDHAWGMKGETLLHTLALTGKPKDLATIDALLEAGADASLPFAGEYKYSRDSNLPMKDRLVRGDVNVLTRVTMLREQGKWAERDLDTLLDVAPAKGVVKPDERVAEVLPGVAKSNDSVVEKLLNSVERDEQPEITKRAAPQIDGDSTLNGKKSAGDLSKDESFVSWLNMRMKTAEWDQYKRGSEEFLGIDHDLEKLSKADPEMARNLWKENTPPGMKLPFYLDPEVEKATQGQRTTNDSKEQGADKHAQEGTQKVAGNAEKDEAYKVPDAIKRRYLEAENRFFFRDAQNKVAFEDRGRKMITEHNDPDVAKSLVDIAEAKGWSKIKVAGHDDFKREVWLQAQLKGIEVTGYKAKDVDHARLKEMQAERMKNSVERDESREQGKESGKAKGSERTPDEEKSYTSPTQNRADNFKGKLLEHGSANYDFDEKNDPSYYVKIETKNGTKMHWGIDLGRAMEHAAVKIGELIELERLGKRPVTVQEKEFDKDGKLIGVKPVEAERIEWSVNGVDMSKDVPKVPEVVVNGSTAKAVVVEKQPAKEVESGVALAPAKTPPKEVEAGAKAQPLNGDYKVPMAALEKVLKAEGINPKAIRAIRGKATEVLQQMAAQGKPAPGVKVFDRKAERERPREKIVTKTKEKENERSR